MVYGAFAALAQKDFKRLVAYSSVSHMGYVVLGIGVWSAVAGNQFNRRLLEDGHERRHVPDDRPRHQLRLACSLWSAWFTTACIIATSISSAACSPRCRSTAAWRSASSSPAWACPGLCGFIGEVFVTLSVWNFSHGLAVVAASVVILTAGYILWTVQRVYLGPEYKGPHGEASDADDAAANWRSPCRCWRWPSCWACIRRRSFNYMTPSVDQTVDDLADWSVE